MRVLLVALAAVVIFPVISAAGPITYTLNDYPALENGYHLSGHITTDGTTGVWTTNHITSWEFAITNSLGTVIVNVQSTDPGATIQSFTPTILASPSSLAVVSGQTGGFVLAQNPTGNANRVGYLPPSDPQRFFGNAGGGAIIWNSEILTGDTFVIASVPAEFELTIDIKPGSNRNSINPGSRGVLPVAILNTGDEDLSTLDPSTATLDGTAPLRWALEDVDGDGDLDIILHFSIPELVADGSLTASSTEATLTVETIDGGLGAGTDSVRIVPSH